jgi:transposase
LLRDCVYVYEQEQQEWAAEMADLLASMARAADEWRRQGAPAIPAEERDAWVAQYFDLLASGFAAQPRSSAEDVPKRGGRPKQSASKNLLDDLRIPFTNELIAN